MISLGTLLAQVRRLARSKPIEVVDRRTARKRSFLSATLGAVLTSLVAILIYQYLGTCFTPNVPAMAVAPQLFIVGNHLCERNDGLRRVEIVMPVNDRYTFICGNGARFDDTFARIKRK